MVKLKESIKETFDMLLKNARVCQAMDFLKEDNAQTTEEQIELTAIPAPTFQESVRGAEYRRRLEALGLENVTVDESGNVFGMRKGTGNGPTIAVGAHLDTVFPDGTDVLAKRKEGRIFAPGIADNGRGLAVVLTLLRAMNNAGIHTQGDVIFGATVGEEGLGDLCGIKALFKNRDDIDGYIAVEPGEPQVITYLATGSRRYRVTFKGPGGHSFGAFGLPSATHALGRAIAMIADLKVPTEPKTTFNVGVIHGGTTVNTIAAEAGMLLDLRSVSPEALTSLETKALEAIRIAAAEENDHWHSEDLTVEIEQVGDRPAGVQSADAVIVQASMAADRGLGLTPVLDEPSSTDANVPISLGIPAVTLGGGGDFAGIHTLGEYYHPAGAYVGPQKILLTLLGLAGMVGEQAPLLEKRKGKAAPE